MINPWSCCDTLIEYIRLRYSKKEKPIMDDDDCDKIGVPEDLKPKPIQYGGYYVKDKGGYPGDDELFIINNSKSFSGTDLEPWYGTQLVSENHDVSGEGHFDSLLLKRVPILAGTLTAEISIDDKKFNIYVNSAGNSKVDYTGDPQNKPLYANLNCQTGDMRIGWMYPPGEYKISILYEINRGF